MDKLGTSILFIIQRLSLLRRDNVGGEQCVNCREVVHSS